MINNSKSRKPADECSQTTHIASPLQRRFTMATSQPSIPPLNPFHQSLVAAYSSGSLAVPTESDVAQVLAASSTTQGGGPTIPTHQLMLAPSVNAPLVPIIPPFEIDDMLQAPAQDEDQASFVSRNSHAVASIISSNQSNASNALLDYPQDFFHVRTGAIPKSEEEAKRFWQHRKDRAKGTVDHVPPNGKVMLREMKAMHQRLTQCAADQFYEGAKQVAARIKKIMVPGMEATPRTMMDLVGGAQEFVEKEGETVDAIATLHEVFLHFNRDRKWLTQVVDQWAESEGIKILPSPEEKKRNHATMRGGFSVIAREAKKNAMQRIMRPLMKKNGWNISATYKAGSKDRTATLVSFRLSDGNNAKCFKVKKNQIALVSDKREARKVQHCPTCPLLI
jgi:hypothetical protein